MHFRFSGLLLFSLLIAIFFPGCEIIGGIFKAGVWAGVLIIAIIVGLIIWAIKALMK